MNNQQSTIENVCVSLRDLERQDAVLLMKLNNDPEIARYVVGTPRQVSLQEQMQWMDRIKNERHTKRFIVECAGQAVGTVIVSNIDTDNFTANMNIKLDGAARGRGIGKRSIQLALKYCFDEIGICCVTAHVLSYNVASIALFESCGFVREGILRSRIVKNGERHDLISFSMVYIDYQRAVSG